MLNLEKNVSNWVWFIKMFIIFYFIYRCEIIFSINISDLNDWGRFFWLKFYWICRKFRWTTLRMFVRFCSKFTNATFCFVIKASFSIFFSFCYRNNFSSNSSFLFAWSSARLAPDAACSNVILFSRIDKLDSLDDRWLCGCIVRAIRWIKGFY